MRARSGKTVLRKRARTRKLTKGFRLGRHNLYRQSLTTLIRGRKSMSEIAIHDPAAFDKLVEIAKANMPADLK